MNPNTRLKPYIAIAAISIGAWALGFMCAVPPQQSVISRTVYNDPALWNDTSAADTIEPGTIVHTYYRDGMFPALVQKDGTYYFISAEGDPLAYTSDTSGPWKCMNVAGIELSVHRPFECK